MEGENLGSEAVRGRENERKGKERIDVSKEKAEAKKKEYEI